MPMKVIVCFDNVRVTVPCGEGTIPVRELISKAVHRFKRATGKGSNHWVEVTSLKTISGGGILDPDDQLNDVVDDREQLIAEYEEQDRPSIQHNGGDGASASSTGTTSPDIFQSGETPALHEHSGAPPIPSFLSSRQNSTSSNNAVATDVVVTPRDLSLGSNLRVRRGSEPSLSSLLEESPTEKSQLTVVNLKPFIPRRESVRDSDEPRSESSDDDRKVKVAMYGSLDRKKLGYNRFARDALRTSLSNRPEMFRWLEAQEKAELRNSQIPAQVQERTGPVEGHDGKDVTTPAQPNTFLVSLHNDGGPLGIHAVPASDNQGKDMGLLIQSIEPDRPVHKDGRIKPNDIIVEINGTSLQDVPFLRAQEIFRAAMDTQEIRLRVVKGGSSTGQSPTQQQGKRTHAPQPPPVMPKPRTHAPLKPSPLTLPTSEAKIISPIPAPRDLIKKTVNAFDSINGTENVESGVANSSTLSRPKPDALPSPRRIPAASPTANVIKPGPPIKAPKKVPPALPARSPNTALSAQTPAVPLNAVTNTRRIGKKIPIQLKKGPLGLGFSVTSRDNQTDGNCPIYIRNILPKGAAVQDGQLRPGDRLLEVNGVEMTGKTQAEAVSFLRMLPEGSMVELVVSRQEEVDEKFKVPRKLGDASAPGSDKICDDVGMDDGVEQPAVSPSQPAHIGDEVDSAVSGINKEKITLHIPLNETGSAGLGVSVKGKTQSSDTGVEDLGIFVKSVLQGGAAYKDGHLKVNDQLLEVNGVKLEGLSNTEAMEALRIAMMEDNQTHGHITLTVARRSGSSSSPFQYGDSPDNTQMDIMSPVVHQRSSSATDVGPIVHQRSSSASDSPTSHRQIFGGDKQMPSPIPPARSKRVAALRERFTSDSGNGLRNESYTRATHDSLNDSSAFTNIMPSPPKQIQSFKESQFRDGKENILIVENDTYTLPDKPQRPHSTIGFMHGPRTSHSSGSDDDAFFRSSVASSKDESDLSPNGDLILPFAREGFGRQSMSEKRKGHLDPRTTEIYKLVKASKENKGLSSGAVAMVPQKAPGQSHASYQLQPGILSSNSMVHVPSESTYQPNRVTADMSSSSIKRAASFEDLAGAGSNAPASGSSSSSQQTRDVSPMWRPSRFGRARGCNDSFRAAVDRSYDALDPALMDTLEEESAESGAFTLDPSNSGRSSISSEANTEDTNSLRRRKAKEKEKKGLFKGFLRFGKGRKSNEEAMRRSRSEERSDDGTASRRDDYTSDRWGAQPFGDAQRKGIVAIPDHNQPQRGRRAGHQDHGRIEEEYARLRDYHVTEQRLRSQSVDPSLGRNPLSSTSSSERRSPFQPFPSSSPDQQRRMHEPMERPDPRNFHPAAVAQGLHVTGQDYIESKHSFTSSGSDPEGKGNLAKAMMSRAEYIQQLRSLYQHQHRQRQGVYPLDDREEQYEEQIQELEERWGSYPKEYEGHARESHVLNFINRPPSRQAEQALRDQYSSSSNVTNLNNSSQFHPSGHHHLYQQQQQQQGQFTTANQSYPGNRPHSRGAPTVFDSSSAYQYQQHFQHQHPHQSLEEVPGSQFRERFSSNDSNKGPVPYHMYEPRSQQHFYTGPAQAYRSTPNQYAHHRGNTPYTDPGSAKV